jgi:hypothetical protein
MINVKKVLVFKKCNRKIPELVRGIQMLWALANMMNFKQESKGSNDEKKS